MTGARRRVRIAVVAVAVVGLLASLAPWLVGSFRRGGGSAVAPGGPVAAAAQARESAGEGRARTPLPASARGRVAGAVRLAGAPVGAGRVDVLASAGAGASHRVTPRADGRYELTDLAPGRWVVTCRASGHRTEQRAVWIEPERSVEGVDFDLALRPSLRVRLLAPDDAPFWLVAHGPRLGRLRPAIGALATAEPPPAEVPWSPGSARSAGAGRLVRSAEPAPDEVGTLELDVDPPVHVSLLLGGLVLRTHRVEPDAEEVVFRLAPAELENLLGTVRVRPVAPSGEPLAGAHLRAVGLPAGSPSVTSDGELVLADLVPGPLELTVHAPDRASRTLHTEVRPAGWHDLGTIELAPAARLVVRVVGPDGEPRRASVRVVPLDGSEPDAALLRATDDGGRLVVDGLAPGRYALRSLGPDERRPRTAELLASRVVVATASSGAAGAEVALPLTAVTELELRPPKSSQAATRYRLLDRGHALREGTLPPEGSAHLLVPRGVYRLELRGATGAPRHVTVEVAGGSPAIVPLASPGALTVVTDAPADDG